MQPYVIEFHRRTSKQLANLPEKLCRRIAEVIDDLATDPYPPKCVKMKGQGNLYRLAVGSYRILCRVWDDDCAVTVVWIGHRGRAYKDLSSLGTL